MRTHQCISLCGTRHYKPTDSHSYLLYSSSHPSHVKNSIPYISFSDFVFVVTTQIFCKLRGNGRFLQQIFFGFLGYPASVVQAGHHRTQQIDRQSALQTSQRENNDRIPAFILTLHSHNHAVNSNVTSKYCEDLFATSTLIYSNATKT